MATSEMYEKDIQEYFKHLESERLSSYKKWPFKTGSCTPAKMAKAGWYHRPTAEAPDATQCFFCFKELEGWEKGDDPCQQSNLFARGVGNNPVNCFPRAHHKGKQIDCPLKRKEHKKHSPNCSFLDFDHPYEQFKVQDFLMLEMQRQKNKVKKIYDSQLKELTEMQDNAKKEMKKLYDGMV